ncbi:MAG: SusC/RagA family TonB-linked outer membrane protein, partial [Bacteroidales bacterium]|nr:SusC/RagA family TonB-linked outer membrane protein [Bacteroidales bacterium]
MKRIIFLLCICVAVAARVDAQQQQPPQQQRPQQQQAISDTATNEPTASIMLDAVVAIGYGTTTKKEVTGSISSLRAEELNKGTFTNAAGLMQGKVAGLTVTNASGGDPNAQYEILLRGNNSLMAKRDPLIIIDGVVDADMRNINFQEVETIDVLKDGSAAAIYGSRGTNGVIIITTKRARAGTTQVEYDGQVSFQTVTRRAKPLSAEDFVYAINNFKPAASGSLYGASTDWFDEVTRTPVSHKHSFAISGGTKLFSHRTVLNVEQNQGIQQKNNADKYMFKTNIHQNILHGWLDLDYNATLSKRKYTPANNDIFRQAFFHNPTEPIYDETNAKYGGYHTVEAMDYFNPVAMLKERTAQSQSDFMEFNGRATLNIVPVEGLKWDNFISYKQERFNSKIYRTRYYPSIVGSDGEAEIGNTYDNQLQWESTVQYSRSFASMHSLQVMAGYTFLQGYYEESSMYNQGYDFDIWLADNIGAGTGLVNGNGGISSFKESNRYISFFGRAMYNYDERYLLSVSLRRDGSSKFGTNYKWGWFPAVSIGWRMNRESFLRDVKWINDLKIRAGYGVTGNQGFGNYKSLVLMEGAGYVLSDGKWVNVYVPVQNSNPDLRWEKKSEWNAGIDFSFFSNRLSGSVDYYMRNVSDLLYEYEVAVPPWDYNSLFTNVGKLSNMGVEILISGIPVREKGFEWSTTLTMAHNKNKLISFTDEEFYNAATNVGWIGDPINAYCQQLTAGGPIGSFFAREYYGVGADGQDIISILKIKNFGSAYPDLTLGWSITFTYKGFDLNIMIRAAIGGKIFNSYRACYENIT